MESVSLSVYLLIEIIRGNLDFCCGCDFSQIYSTFITFLTIIMFSVVILFHYDIFELERSESVTFILPCHCPPVLIIYAGQTTVLEHFLPPKITLFADRFHDCFFNPSLIDAAFDELSNNRN